jgi:phosphomevalonate kinase
MERVLSAPGKLFLAGEYAVLWGGVARVLAVGPRVQALVRRRADRRVIIALDEGRLQGDATPAGVRWSSEVTAGFHFVARTLDLFFRAAGKEGPGFEVAFEPSPLHEGQKLGLGSSARAVVLAAEAARWALDAELDTLKLSLVAHAVAQHGKGSGGDVAASFAGGLVRYLKYDTSVLQASAKRGDFWSTLLQSPPVEVSRTPEPKLPLVYAFSGQSASTRALIGAVEQQLDQTGRARFVTASDALGDGLERALVRGDFEAAREAAHELQQLLHGLSQTRSEALDRLLQLGEAFGCGGKQSGAGGGDGAIFIAPDEAAAQALIGGCRARGLLALRLSVEPGLRGEPVRLESLAGWLDATAD